MTWRRATSFDAIAAYDFAGPGMNLSGGGFPEQVRGILSKGEGLRRDRERTFR